MFLVGITLAFADRTASAGTAWAVAFLLVVLLLISKFKRFKGFGFEAEMWEQKQAEAAALVDQLKSLSKVISKQMAVLATRVGRPEDAALSFEELAELLEDLQQQLRATEVPSHEADEALRSLYAQITLCYHSQARNGVLIAWSRAEQLIKEELQSTDEEKRKKAESMASDMNQEHTRLLNVQFLGADALVEFVASSKVIGANTKLNDRLKEIAADLQYFKVHHSIRRKHP